MHISMRDSLVNQLSEHKQNRQLYDTVLVYEEQNRTAANTIEAWCTSPTPARIISQSADERVSLTGASAFICAAASYLQAACNTWGNEAAEATVILAASGPSSTADSPLLAP